MVSYAIDGSLVQLESAGFVSADGTVNATAITAALMAAVDPAGSASLGVSSFTITTGVVAERFTHELGAAIGFSPPAAVAAVSAGLAAHLGIPVSSINVTAAEFTRTNFQMCASRAHSVPRLPPRSLRPPPVPRSLPLLWSLHLTRAARSRSRRTVSMSVAGNHAAVAAAVAALTHESASTVAAQSMADLLCGASYCVDSWVHVLPPVVAVVASSSAGVAAERAASAAGGAPHPPEYTWQFYLNATIFVSTPVPTNFDGAETPFEAAVAAALGIPLATVFVVDIAPSSLGDATAAFDIQIVASSGAAVAAANEALNAALAAPGNALLNALKTASPSFFGSLTSLGDEGAAAPSMWVGVGGPGTLASTLAPVSAPGLVPFTATVVVYGYSTSSFGVPEQAWFKTAVADEIAVVLPAAVSVDSVVSYAPSTRRSMLSSTPAVAVTFTAMVPRSYDTSKFSLTLGQLTAAGLGDTTKAQLLPGGVGAGGSPATPSGASSAASPAVVGASASLAVAAVLVIIAGGVFFRRRHLARLASRASKVSDKIAVAPLTSSAAPFLMPRRAHGDADDAAVAASIATACGGDNQPYVDLVLEPSAPSRGGSLVGTPAPSRLASPGSASASRGSRVARALSSPGALLRGGDASPSSSNRRAHPSASSLAHLAALAAPSAARDDDPESPRCDGDGGDGGGRSFSPAPRSASAAPRSKR